MTHLRRMFPFALVLLLAMVVAACGGSTSSGSSATPAPTATTAATPTSASPAALVQTATATVKGQSKTILTDAQGKTLYYFTSDTATTSACTGGCAQNWPPLLFTGSGAPTSASSLPGQLTAVTTASGNQVEYNGHLLYTYYGDSAAGQTNGEGLFGKWFVATTDLTAGSSSSNAVVNTATATLNGQSKTILTDAKGMTLYYFTPDSATTSACTGGCAQNWPPLLFTGSGAPTGATSLTGQLKAVTTANGNQIEYNGHLLYTFSGDSAAGQTNGQGVAGKWFAATTDLK